MRYGPKKAVTNPESFTLYALAYYLGQTTQYTFASSKSAKKPVPTPKRRLDDSTNDDPKKNILVTFQPVKRGLADNSWVA